MKRDFILFSVLDGKKNKTLFQATIIMLCSLGTFHRVSRHYHKAVACDK